MLCRLGWPLVANRQSSTLALVHQPIPICTKKNVNPFAPSKETTRSDDEDDDNNDMDDNDFGSDREGGDTDDLFGADFDVDIEE